VQDDENPTHYENRLTADLGSRLGLNAADVRRAEHDEHANSRFHRLRSKDAEAAMVRCRELFDMEALVRNFVSEVNSFSDKSSSESLPRLFLDWACKNLSEQHIVFDEETCSRVDIDSVFALSVLEHLFLGRSYGCSDDSFRGIELHRLFVERETPWVDDIVNAPEFEEKLGPQSSDNKEEHDAQWMTCFVSASAQSLLAAAADFLPALSQQLVALAGDVLPNSRSLPHCRAMRHKLDDTVAM